MGGLLLFDVTNRRSFLNVRAWLAEAEAASGPERASLVLVGHKCDVGSGSEGEEGEEGEEGAGRRPRRRVTRAEAEAEAAAHGLRYVETSARDDVNVEAAFAALARDIYDRVRRGEIREREGWEGVRGGPVPGIVTSSEEAPRPTRGCPC